MTLNADKPVFFLKDGRPVEFVFVHDWPARSKALDMVFKMHGAYATKEDQMKDATSVRVIRIDVPRPRPPAIKPNPLPPNNPLKK